MRILSSWGEGKRRTQRVRLRRRTGGGGGRGTRGERRLKDFQTAVRKKKGLTWAVIGKGGG